MFFGSKIGEPLYIFIGSHPVSGTYGFPFLSFQLCYLSFLWYFIHVFYVVIEGNLGERNGNPLQYSCLENSMDGEPGRLQSMGSQSWIQLSDFSYLLIEGKGSVHHSARIKVFTKNFKNWPYNLILLIQNGELILLILNLSSQKFHFLF